MPGYENLGVEKRILRISWLEEAEIAKTGKMAAILEIADFPREDFRKKIFFWNFLHKTPSEQGFRGEPVWYLKKCENHCTLKGKGDLNMVENGGISASRSTVKNQGNCDDLICELSLKK